MLKNSAGINEICFELRAIFRNATSHKMLPHCVLKHFIPLKTWKYYVSKVEVKRDFWLSYDKYIVV
jgi:hypothetical protein